LAASACLAWSTLLRQPYGLGGFLVVLLVLVFRWSQAIRNSGSAWKSIAVWRICVVLGALTLATFYASSLLVALRGVIHDVPRSSSAIMSHGISHNLYMGLGVPGNPWGIEWDDVKALTSAGLADQVQYGSIDHYRGLRDRYVQILVSSPVVVASIYGRKFVDSVLEVTQNRTPARRATLWGLLLLLLTAVLARARRRLTTAELTTLLAAWASFGLILLQGVLALPEHQFISPGKFAAFLGFAVLTECVLRGVLQEPADYAATVAT
jgi:hypothetical protein